MAGHRPELPGPARWRPCPQLLRAAPDPARARPAHTQRGPLGSSLPPARASCNPPRTPCARAPGTTWECSGWALAPMSPRPGPGSPRNQVLEEARGGAKDGGGGRLLGNSVPERKWLPTRLVSRVPNTDFPPALLGLRHRPKEVTSPVAVLGAPCLSSLYAMAVA